MQWKETGNCLINLQNLLTKGKKKDSFIEILYLFSFPKMAKFIVGKSALYNISPLHQDRRFAKDSKTAPHFIKPRKQISSIFIGPESNHCSLVFGPLGLSNLWKAVNRIRFIMGKIGCTQIRTSISCSSEKNFFKSVFWILNFLPRGLIALWKIVLDLPGYVLVRTS